MKLFHKENGKEVVYVKRQDIMYLLRNGIPTLETIANKFLEDSSVVTQKNRFDFVMFEDSDELEFFKELKFIVNYDDYKDFSEEKLDQEIRKMKAEKQAIEIKIGNMSQDEVLENIGILQDLYDLEYMLELMMQIVALKRNEIIMPFPKFIKKYKQRKKYFHKKKVK